MSRSLRLKRIGADGTEEIATVSGDMVILGREAPLDLLEGQYPVVLNSKLVSRRHGILYFQKNYWLYKDLGSTNGSFLNGVTLIQRQWRIVRPGDLLQLADETLVLDYDGPRLPDGREGQEAGRSLLVLHEERFNSEYRVAAAGRIVSFGSAKDDLPLSDEAGGSVLSVELRNVNLCAVRHLGDYPVTVNGQELADLVNLFDGDVIEVDHYTVIVNDPVSAPRKSPDSAAKAAKKEKPGEAESRSVGRTQLTVFGKADPEDFDMPEGERRKTQVINPGEFLGRMERAGEAPSQGRRMVGADNAPKGADLGNLENLVILGFAGVLILGLVVMGLYFLFT